MRVFKVMAISAIVTITTVAHAKRSIGKMSMKSWEGPRQYPMMCIAMDSRAPICR
jgi:hypothetical protein